MCIRYMTLEKEMLTQDGWTVTGKYRFIKFYMYGTITSRGSVKHLVMMLSTKLNFL